MQLAVGIGKRFLRLVQIIYTNECFAILFTSHFTLQLLVLARQSLLLLDNLLVQMLHLQQLSSDILQIALRRLQFRLNLVYLVFSHLRFRIHYLLQLDFQVRHELLELLLGALKNGDGILRLNNDTTFIIYNHALLFTFSKSTMSTSTSLWRRLFAFSSCEIFCSITSICSSYSACFCIIFFLQRFITFSSFPVIPSVCY